VNPFPKGSLVRVRADAPWEQRGTQGRVGIVVSRESSKLVMVQWPGVKTREQYAPGFLELAPSPASPVVGEGPTPP
jgi:hypothetical protein